MSAPSDLRLPAVAGRFYPGEARALDAAVAGYLGTAGPGERCLGLMAPHAGYVYSGGCAGAAYARVRVPAQAIVLSPNHTGRGVRGAVWPGGAWRLPGGDIAIDEALRDALLAATPLLARDRRAHEAEHSLEVQLPFLRARRGDVRIVAMTLGGLHRDECLELGRAIAGVVRGRDDVLLCASSDMSHYVPAQVAAERDRLALDRMEALDPAGLYDVVDRNDISMCGFIPATVMLAATVELGATRAEVVRYTNSGEVSGDYDAVVGYAGVIVR
jgi:AmmeMemoRadiSam system protein B